MVYKTRRLRAVVLIRLMLLCIALACAGCDPNETNSMEAGGVPGSDNEEPDNGECGALQEEALGACCQLSPFDGELPSAALPPNAERIAVDACVRGALAGPQAQGYVDANGDGEFQPDEAIDADFPAEVICVRRSAVESAVNPEGEFALPPEEEVVGELQRPDGTCNAVLQRLERAECGVPACESEDVIEQRARLLPTCEMIESLQDACVGPRSPWPSPRETSETYKAYQRAFGGPNPWTPWRTPTGVPAETPRWRAGQQDHEADRVGFPAVQITSLEDAEPVFDRSSAPIESMRIEVPSNFARYQIARTLGPVALDRAASFRNDGMASQGEVYPLKCDPETLTCDWNLLLAIPFDQVFDG